MLSITRRVGETFLIGEMKLTLCSADLDSAIITLSDVGLDSLHEDVKSRLVSESPIRFKIEKPDRINIASSVLIELGRSNSGSARIRVSAPRSLSIVREELLDSSA